VRGGSRRYDRAVASTRPDRWRDDPWWMAGLATVGVLLHITHRVRFVGTENIPAEGPAILASNHVSPLDPIAIALAASERRRTVRYLTAAEAFGIPVIGWGLRRFRQIPLHRGARDRAALEDVLSVIRGGALAGIFPEGGLGDGPELRPARRGMARIALATGAPVIPAGVWGFQVRWPRGGIRWRPPVRPIGVTVIGRAIESKGDADSQEDVTGLTETVMSRVARLVDRARELAGA
jgi:1-acyl-sn-glycerol-3-phosphate acyltransferase